MRLWSLHPRHLDPQGLVALWREGLLARKVLRGETRGYKHHPQLDRFYAHTQPRSAMDAYLHAVCDEADARGYKFDRSKLGPRRAVDIMDTPGGQIEFEWEHLMQKLASRSPTLHEAQQNLAKPELHPLCHRVRGGIAEWERP